MSATHKTIQIEYKDNLLKGEYSYSAKDLYVRLKTPQGDLQKGVHIPYMAPKQWTEDLAETRAREVISELWNFYRSVLAHKEEIINLLPIIQEKKGLMEKEKEHEECEMQRLKSMLKEGVVSNVEYQKAYMPHKRRYENIELEQNRIFQNAVEDILKDNLFSVDSPEAAILNILEVNNMIDESNNA